MRQTILTVLMTLLTAGAAQAENRTVTIVDSVNNQTKVIELTDNVVNGQTVADTVSITTYPGTNIDKLTQPPVGYHPSEEDNDDFLKFSPFLATTLLIPLAGIIFGIGLPILAITLVIYYRHKRRMAKYRLAEMALNAGQQLPPDFFSEISVQNKRSRGIANLFLGIGLFFLLYTLSEELFLGCIGVLISCIGIGQIVSFYAEQRDNANSDRTANHSQPNRNPDHTTLDEQ